MARFWIGTSGWQYDHWRGAFYPPRLPKDAWFGHYKRFFQTVEINNSFYRLPGRETWRRWHDAAGPDFRYAVKASRYLTHMKRFKDPEEPLRRFLEGAQLLGETLGPVLFQAPPNFHRTPENVRRLDAFLALLRPDRRFAFEFRHASWFGQETLRQLREGRAAFCIYDMPDVECPLAATAGFAYVRFHGAGSAYAGNYPDHALQVWADRLSALAADVDEVWAYFNNDVHGFAVSNALTLKKLLGA